mmetsp:Transcript_12094/g.33983  ORF Transcript_12094/g.33983 Transcript_12094/m.33983 type:complete len:442 (-) Transcript_12094:470-1795(-)
MTGRKLYVVLLAIAAAACSGDPTEDVPQGPWTEGNCNYGTLPGYWWASRYKSFSKSCKFKRLVEQHSPKAVQKMPTPQGFRGKTHILLIGDSLDRNVVIALSEWSGRPYRDYTPMIWLPDGRPQKIGRNGIVNFANHTYANLFIFAANNEEKYYRLWKDGMAPGMSHATFDRICHDGPKYLPYFPAHSPYMISLNSAYWEVGRWEQRYGRPDRHTLRLTGGNFTHKSIGRVFAAFNETMSVNPQDPPTYAHASAPRLGTPVFDGMVIRYPNIKQEQNYMKELLWDFKKELEELMDKVKACYPDTQIYCLRTAPRVATDDRIHHFFQKRPHVITALNQLIRFTAKKRGWCVLDMDMMLQAHGNNEEFVPDGAHPAAWVNLEYANIILNVIKEEKTRSAHTHLDHETETEEENEDPEVRALLRKAVKEEEAYREHHPHSYAGY